MPSGHPRRLWVSAIGVAAATLTGAVAFQLSRSGPLLSTTTREALGVLELPAGASQAQADVVVPAAIERFHVSAWGRGDGVTLTLDAGAFGSYRGPIRGGTRFMLGQGIPPGTYMAELTGPPGHGPVTVVIADRWVGVTGWQILVAVMLAGLVVAGVVTSAIRKPNSRLRAQAAHVFRVLSVAAVALFVYLLCHEGGHALAALAFGKFDLAGSDFWGLHGNPHSGLRGDVAVASWQQSVVAIAGPLLPNLVGWVLFVAWRSPRVWRRREGSPTLDLFWSGVTALLLFPAVALLGYALDLVSDSDWQGFSGNVPVSAILARAGAVAVAAVSLTMLWPPGRQAALLIMASARNAPAAVTGANRAPDPDN